MPFFILKTNVEIIQSILHNVHYSIIVTAPTHSVAVCVRVLLRVARGGRVRGGAGRGLDAAAALRLLHAHAPRPERVH